MKVRIKQLTVDAAFPLAVFVKASIPSPVGIAGSVAYVTDAVGGPLPVFSDGANWLLWSDRTVLA